jgi:antitoxin ParD1/3/4
MLSSSPEFPKGNSKAIQLQPMALDSPKICQANSGTHLQAIDRVISAVLLCNTGAIMQRNSSVTLGEHFSSFITHKIEEGRFESVSEAVRAGLRLLELEEAKLDALRARLAEGEAQIARGDAVDGDAFMRQLTGE